MDTSVQDGSEAQKADVKADAPRVLMGVIRVGLFAKRIMLDGDVLAELVVVCAEKPTTTLLHHIATLMAGEILVDTLMFSDEVALLVGRWNCDAGSTPGWALLCSGLEQSTYTCVPLSPSSIIWYRPRVVISLAGKVTAGLVESNGASIIILLWED